MVIVQPFGLPSSPTFNDATLTAAADPTTVVAETSALNERLLRQVWSQNGFSSIYPDSLSFDSTASGTSAAAFKNFGKCRLVSGTDAAGFAAIFSLDKVGSQLTAPGGIIDHIDFSKPFWVDVRFAAGATAIGGGNLTSLGASAFVLWTIGKANGNGALGSLGFGFKLVFATNTTVGVQILTHDGSLHTSANIATINFEAGGNTAIIHAISFYNNGAGTLYVYVDGVYITSVATAPTTATTSGAYMVGEINNGAGTDSSEIIFTEFRIGLKKN